MTTEEILSIVFDELEIPLNAMKSSHRDDVMDAKYIVILMMHEEGYKPTHISQLFGGDRTGAYHALNKANSLLDYHYPFKQKYLRCIANMARREEVSIEKD